MNDKDFHELYSRGAEYGFVTSEAQLIKNVQLEDQKKFREELKQITFPCPECGKKHNLSQNNIGMLCKISCNKSLGKTSFTTVCPTIKVLLDMKMNFRTGNFATPIFDLKKENVKIAVKSLRTLAFEREDFEKLTEEELKQIIAYHPSTKEIVTKALEELEIRKLAAPNLQTETIEPKKKTGFINKIKTTFKKVFPLK